MALRASTIRGAVDALSETGIGNEFNGERRRRVFACKTCPEILSEGAQPL
ncbi:hypothetical protein [Chiayiivirga flava]|uniref:Uncharacterized protein n=1 Tax=Chiayiivirga flava TaxID=659595 RepID=A0A7W8D6T2_9GAMM|nr:hypothetical protein [Chiayiivirga flava]MBB5207752.1 hypothetical protein [Chiayiivirga flava]